MSEIITEFRVISTLVMSWISHEMSSGLEKLAGLVLCEQGREKRVDKLHYSLFSLYFPLLEEYLIAPNAT